MRSLFVLGIVLMVGLGCDEKPSETGPEIIDRSIEAHGGKEVYERLDQVVFLKTTQLFLEDGSLESKTVQKQSFQFMPHRISQIEWEQDSIHHKLVYNGLEVHKKRGDSVILNSEALKKAENRLKAAEYVFFQPFKLNDQWTDQVYLGTHQLNDTLEVAEVMISYPENPEADTWWYYFDVNYQLVATKVRHNGRYSLIENLEFQNYKGLLFNKHRKSYFVDSLGNKKYLRAEYFYEILE